jgi:hypothetical protein
MLAWPFSPEWAALSWSQDLPGHLVSFAAVRVRHDHRELIAAQAGRHGLRPRRPVQRAAELPQDDVADLVAELVVDQLQVVHVDHDDGELPAGALRRLQLLLRR